MFVVGVVISIFVALILLSLAVYAFSEGEMKLSISILALAVVVSLLFLWLQTHRIVPVQHVGISRNTFTQELDGLYQSGLMLKPFFGRVYNYPASSALERCEQYTPAIKGSYGIVVDLCFYYDAGNIDWLEEIRRTGSLDANQIMSVWRNSVVSGVAQSVKDYTPEALSDNRSEVEQALFENVFPWFAERGIPLVRVSFKNWDFTSEEVASSFDASIVSQRKIAEQTALFEAAKISRQRETYEAETSKLVADKQKDALDILGLSGSEAVEYLWIKMLAEQGKSPDVLILGTSNVPVSIPLQGKLVDID